MEIKLALGTHLVLFVVCQVDALSPSSSSISHNSSYSSVTPTSSHFIQSTSKPTASSPRCHQLKVCWLNSPPYLFKDDDTGNISGAFNEAIEFLLSKCKNDCNPKPAYKRCENSSSKLNYSRDQVENARELTECMKMKSGFDLVFPVLSSHVMSDNFHKVRFQDIVSSPGIAVLKNRELLVNKARWNVIKEFSQIWTVIVLALLLNAIFGILMWVLVSRHVLFYEEDTSNFWTFDPWIIMSRSFQTLRHQKIHSNVKKSLCVHRKRPFHDLLQCGLTPSRVRGRQFNFKFLCLSVTVSKVRRKR